MLSGLSLSNLPTAANLSNLTAQQIQPATVDNASQAANNSQGNASAAGDSASNASAANTASNSSNATNNSNQAEANQANNEAQAKTADFKQVMQSTAADKTNKDASKTSDDVQANTETAEHSDDELDASELSAAVAEVLATITTSLNNTSDLNVELNLDFSDLPIEELPVYEAAITLVDQEVQSMMSDTIDAISSIDMTDLNALTQQAEMLDDLQSVHEELLEAGDELRYIQDSQADQSALSFIDDVEIDTQEEGIDIQGFQAVAAVELTAVNTDIKPEQVKDQDAGDQIKAIQDLHIEAVKQDDTQKIQVKTDSVEEASVQAVVAEIADDQSEETKIEEKSAKVEIQTKDSSNKENFLDKIKFITLKESTSANKVQVDNKANLDARVKQVLIQAADEIKSIITERAQNRNVDIKTDDIKIHIEIQDVDISDNVQTDLLGKLATDTFKHLNTIKPEAPVLSPKEVIHIVHDKVMAAPVNTQQVLRFQLHPKDLGNITITITKEAKGVTIQMVVDNDAALSSLKQDISSLSSSLRDKGLELKDIDISKASSEGTSSQQQQRGDFNEAREEQKKRMNEGQPFWLSEEATKSSFETQLKGMLNLWRSKV